MTVVLENASLCNLSEVKADQTFRFVHNKNAAHCYCLGKQTGVHPVSGLAVECVGYLEFVPGAVILHTQMDLKDAKKVSVELIDFDVVVKSKLTKEQ